MTIVVAVKKDGKICLAADTQSNFECLKVSQSYIKNNGKIFKHGNSFIGVTGWTAITQMFEHVITVNPNAFNFTNRWSIYESLLEMQEVFKEYYHLESNENEDQPVQSNHIDGLIINGAGIFEIGSYREVNVHNKFWALGSGNLLALGAMHATYEMKLTAKQIAKAGIKAAAEFDDGCGLPLEIQEISCG